MANKVLIAVLPGGVTGLFNLLKLNQFEGIEYFSVNFNKKNGNIFFLPLVYFQFILRMLKVQVVHLNPSLDTKSFYRDMIFAFISKKIFKKKTIIYWHGWDDIFYVSIKNSKIKKFLFCKTFGIVDVQLVLANEFRNNIRKLGYNKEILLESNVTAKVDVLERKEYISNKQNINLLFISRITKGKGWDIAIETMRILNKTNNNITLTIAGDGDCLNEAKGLVVQYNLKNVNFAGYVNGNNKAIILSKSDILFFPTCYGEGMPIAILEGMMYGMPIISRNVGGIPDHVIDGINGLLTDSIKPEDFANMIINITNEILILNKFRVNNIEKARREFIPERLINRLLTLYNYPIN